MDTESRKSAILPRITCTLTVTLALLSAACLLIPLSSATGSGPNLITLAWAWEDNPSGIYIDRGFDWPTGEAVWVDLPVWALQAGLLAMTSASVWGHWWISRQPTSERHAQGMDRSPC